MKFEEVIGHHHIKQRLMNSVTTHHVAHAQLFVGAEGTGALPLALAYARYVQCTNRTEGVDACGVCSSCVKHNKLSHPDFHLAFPMVKDDKKVKVCDDLVQEFRDALLQADGYLSYPEWLDKMDSKNKQAQIYAGEGEEIARKMSYKTHESEYKIMLIWLPEKMNTVCANKILKILEEPFPKTLFLLVAEDEERILPTIQSRTQKLYIPSIDDQEIANALTERFSLMPKRAEEVARLSLGNYISAVNTIRSEEYSDEFLQLFINLMRRAYSIIMNDNPNDPFFKYNAIKEMMSAVGVICSWSREKQRQYLQYAQYLIRENYIANLQCRELNYMNQGEQDFASRFSRFINERNVEGFIQEYAKAQYQIEQNVNAQYVFTDIAFQAVLLLKR